MYEYAYVPIQIGRGINTPQHRRIIQEKAQDGWRYVGTIPTVVSKSNAILEYDLVFERKL